MTSTPAPLVIRPFASDEWPAYRDIRLRALADAPEAFCSTLAEEQARSDDDWAGRLARATESGIDRPLAALLDNKMVGLTWAKVDSVDSSVVNIFQMWVAPEARGRKVAVALLEDAIAWARSRQASAVQLGVVSGNMAAAQLYEKIGFRTTARGEVVRAGVTLVEQIMRYDLAAVVA